MMRVSPLRADSDRPFFFFQAEDGIRDGTVTGVQTCALPICCRAGLHQLRATFVPATAPWGLVTSLVLPLFEQVSQVCQLLLEDRKSTRRNSSHSSISYAVFCLKKKKRIDLITASRLLVHSIT